MFKPKRKRPVFLAIDIIGLSLYLIVLRIVGKERYSGRQKEKQARELKEKGEQCLNVQLHMIGFVRAIYMFVLLCMRSKYSMAKGKCAGFMHKYVTPRQTLC
jgi:hypothetical protein